MNIKQLRYFVEVCEARSFSKAAERLYISQQGLSMAIMRLETELSCVLFDRMHDGLVITQEGEYLLPRAIEILKYTEECERHFERINKRCGPVRLCAATSALNEYAGDLIFGFQQENQKYEMKVCECNDVMCDSEVENGKAELAFTLGPVDEQKFDSVMMSSQCLYLLTSNDALFSQHSFVRLDALESLPLTIMWDGVKINSRIVECCREKGFIPEIRHIVTTPAFARRAVIEGSSTALLLRSDVYEIGSSGQLKAIPLNEGSVNWTSYMIKKRGGSLSAGAREFEQYVLQNMK